MDQGAVLFGVADPSETLKHGTVVIQLTPQREVPAVSIFPAPPDDDKERFLTNPPN